MVDIDYSRLFPAEYSYANVSKMTVLNFISRNCALGGAVMANSRVYQHPNPIPVLAVPGTGKQLTLR